MKLALVEYVDEYGRPFTQLGVVGKKTVHLLNGKVTGLSRDSTHEGRAPQWLRDEVFKVLGIELPAEEVKAQGKAVKPVRQGRGKKPVEEKSL